MTRRVVLVAVILLTLGVPQLVTTGQSAELDVMSWNVESGGSNSAVIAGQIADFQGIDLWGLVEVQDAQVADMFKAAAAVGENTTFDSILGTTGGADRMLILYDTARFDKLGQSELTDINLGGNVRAPLVAQFHDRVTGQDFYFMVNHLYRSNNGARHQQAQMLNDWGEQQPFPVIAIGDYNFDYEVVGGAQTHDLGYDNMIADGVFRWVQPATLVTTECSVTSSHTCRFNSVLDFIFVSGAAQTWTASSEIIVRPNDFPDDNTTSDHRPLVGHFQPEGLQPTEEPTAEPTIEPALTAEPPTAEPVPTVEVTAAPVDKQQLLDRIAQIEQELSELRALVEQMP